MRDKTAEYVVLRELYRQLLETETEVEFKQRVAAAHSTLRGHGYDDEDIESFDGVLLKEAQENAATLKNTAAAARIVMMLKAR